MYTAPKETAQRFDHLKNYNAESLAGVRRHLAETFGDPAPRIDANANGVAFYFSAELYALRFAFHYSQSTGVAIEETGAGWCVTFDADRL
jgi:hypothetical protein